MFFSLGVAFGDLNPSFFIYCVVDGLLLGGFQLLGVFPCVLELPSVMFFSLGATFGESNPPSFSMVLLMVFFFIALGSWCYS
jgi:hypothetical protein